MNVLSNNELSFFKAKGYLHLKGMLSDDEISNVNLDSLEMIEPKLWGPCDDDRWLYNKTKDNREILRRIDGLDAPDMPQSFQVLLGNPRLLWAVHQLMEGDYFAASVQALVYKGAKYGSSLKWHQDPINIRRFPAFNMDIYLDKATVENGCLYVIPESHLAGYHGCDPGFIEHWTDGKGVEAEKAVPVEANRGDVIFHATSVLHASGENNTSSSRRTIYYHFDRHEDVKLSKLSGDEWPWWRTKFPEAQKIMAKAIELRSGIYPDETPFPYKHI
jgi:hypothetical protein